MIENIKQQVSSSEYNDNWINETWGWDSPENFIKSQGKNLRPRILASIGLADLKPGMRVLDIGCGRGEVVLYCGRMGIDAVGIDYSESVLELAKKARATYTLQEQNRMQFVSGDIKLIANSGFYDRIFMLDFVEHLHDIELIEIFKICCNLLKPEGILIIHTLPNKWLYEITYKKVLCLFMPWLSADPRTEKEKSIHINEMTITHLNCILSQVGFKTRVWLQDLIVEQAVWHKRQPLADRRGKIYKLLCNPVLGFLYKVLAKTPLRLFIVNEIFAVAWKNTIRPPVKMPIRMTERLIIAMKRLID